MAVFTFTFRLKGDAASDAAIYGRIHAYAIAEAENKFIALGRCEGYFSINLEEWSWTPPLIRGMGHRPPRGVASAVAQAIKDKKNKEWTLDSAINMSRAPRQSKQAYKVRHAGRHTFL